MTAFSFEKVSFRPSFKEQEYLYALNEQYHCLTMTEFWRTFLGDCMRTGVGNVNHFKSNGYNHTGAVREHGYRESTNVYREHGQMRDNSHGFDDIKDLVIQRLTQKVQELQTLANQQNYTIAQQRMHIDQLLRPPIPSLNIDPYALFVPTQSSFDPMSVLASEMDKAEKLIGAIDRIRRR
jgi:hypothetical protein